LTLLLKKFDYQPIKRKQVNGKRKYLTPDGGAVASVTTILDATKDKTGLMEWRRRVGETKAQQITTEAAGIGTRLHKYIEDYIETAEWSSPGSNPHAKKAHTMATVIKERAMCDITEYWGSEVPLYMPNYFLQLVAYAEAHNEIYGTDIREGHIFMCTRGNDSLKIGGEEYQQFDVWPDEYAEWRKEWYNRVYAYYEQQV